MMGHRKSFPPAGTHRKLAADPDLILDRLSDHPEFVDELPDVFAKQLFPEDEQVSDRPVRLLTAVNDRVARVDELEDCRLLIEDFQAGQGDSGEAIGQIKRFGDGLSHDGFLHSAGMSLRQATRSVY